MYALEARSWPEVSSFGFGGTNAHAMAFANNVCTKRDVTKKDYRSLMMQKILQAPVGL